MLLMDDKAVAWIVAATMGAGILSWHFVVEAEDVCGLWPEIGDAGSFCYI